MLLLFIRLVMALFVFSCSVSYYHKGRIRSLVLSTALLFCCLALLVCFEQPPYVVFDTGLVIVFLINVVLINIAKTHLSTFNKVSSVLALFNTFVLCIYLAALVYDTAHGLSFCIDASPVKWLADSVSSFAHLSPTDCAPMHTFR